VTTRARRGIALILLVIHLAGCSSWQAVNDVGSANRVRVTRLSGEQVELTQPTVRGDTIVAGSIAIPRSDVERLEARRLSAGRTLLLIASIPLIVPTLYFLSFAFCDSDTRCGDFSGTGY
jgi:hypothetical protein